MAGSHDAERICEEILQTDFVDEVEKMVQQQTVLFNDYDWSDDLFASLDKEDYDLLQKCIAEFDLTLSDCNIPSYPVLQDLTSYPIVVGYSQTIPEAEVRQVSTDRITERTTPLRGTPLQQKEHHQMENVMPHLITVNPEGNFEQTEGVLRLKKRQIHSNILVDRGDSAAEKSPVVRKKSKTHICQECGKGFRFNSQLIIHTRGHTGEKPFECGKCGAAFRDKFVLTRHSLIHTNKKEFECNVCNRSFRRKNHLSGHMSIHNLTLPDFCPTHFKESKTHICQECGKEFRFNHQLIKHTRSHTGETPFECGKCGAAFRDKSVLTQHSLIHTNKKEFECNVCNRSFRRKNHLSGHMSIHNLTLPDFCPTHFKESKTNICQECGKGFRFNSQLIRHIRSHTGEKPFECGKCGAAFSNKCALTTHSLIHTNKKEFECNVCNRSFRLKHQLSSHMSTHNRTRPHQCNVCKNTFRNKIELTKHFRVHVKDKE